MMDCNCLYPGCLIQGIKTGKSDLPVCFLDLSLKVLENNSFSIWKNEGKLLEV